ncbi:hypothetical protein WISP_93971 [Willisornis vidua]|uniref:Uncharacterized protein n=1 Tax=Willisornis vidua TaxID=1566151 RepID=A0ABQ9D3I1_9PASS|nr:hypothetical protein WISP_93971 [Willisornis vidua]
MPSKEQSQKMRHKTPLVMRKRKRHYRNIVEKSTLPLIPTTSSTTTIIIIIIIIIWQAKPRWSLVKRERLARRSHQQPLTPSLTQPRLWQQVATPDTMVTTTTQKLGIPLCSLDSVSSLPMQLQVAI